MAWILRGSLGLAAALTASLAFAGSMAPYGNYDLAGAGPGWNAMSDRGANPVCCSSGGGSRYIPVPVRSADDYYTYDNGYNGSYEGYGAAYPAPQSYGRPSYVPDDYVAPTYVTQPMPVPPPTYAPAPNCCEREGGIDRSAYYDDGGYGRTLSNRTYATYGSAYQGYYEDRYAQPAPVQYYGPAYDNQSVYQGGYAVQSYVDESQDYSSYGYGNGYSYGGGYSSGGCGGGGNGCGGSYYGSQDRYGPPVDSRRDYGYAQQPSFNVHSYGGAEQHYGAPRCHNTQGRPCNCDEVGAIMPGEIRLGQGFMYSDGGVGPIPDGPSGGGGGVVVMGGGGGGGGGAYASATALSSSSSNVSINYGGGHGGGGHGGWGGGGHGGGGHGGGGGGCNSCGGGGHGGGGHH